MADRLVPLDGAYKVEVETTSGHQARYWKGKDGTITVEDQRDANWLLKEGLAFRASATGPVAHLRGFVCPTCRRRNYFKTCGGCGSAEGRRE